MMRIEPGPFRVVTSDGRELRLDRLADAQLADKIMAAIDTVGLSPNDVCAVELGDDLIVERACHDDRGHLLLVDDEVAVERIRVEG
jgi:hypothetical protein